MELAPTEYSNLWVSPKETKKGLDIEITFDTTNDVSVYMNMIGLMNQVAKFAFIKTSFKQIVC